MYIISDKELFLSLRLNNLPLQETKEHAQIDTLNSLSWEIRYSDPVKAKELALEALDLSKKNFYSKGIAYSLLNKATSAFLLSSGDESMLLNLNEALHYFEQHNEERGMTKALSYLGNVYDSYGEYDKGLASCLRGLKIAEISGFKEEMGDILSTTGNIYLRLTDYQQALACYQKSLSIREDLNEMRAAASSMNLLARTYTLQGDFENGLNYYQRSLKLRKEIEDPALPWTYLGLAVLYEKKKDNAQALEYYKTCRELNKKNGDRRLELHCLIGIAKQCIVSKDNVQGIQYLNEALSLATAINAKPLQYEVHELLSSIYKSEKNIEKAYTHFKLFHSLREEVLNAESSNKLKNQQISFALERAEKDAEIERIRNVELKTAYDKIDEKNKDITSSINYALRIQRAMLPNIEEVKKVLPQSFILFRPKDIVSGDFYWMEHTEHTLLIAAADCTGHGVPGALMSMLGNEKLKDAAKQTADVSALLGIVNREIKKALRQQGKEEDTKDGMDIAACAINISSLTLSYSAANRPLWLLRKTASEIEEIKATKTAIAGYTEDSQTFEKHTFDLQPGDTFYIFSDGFADQFGGENGKKLTTKRFRELVMSMRDRSMPEQLVLLDKAYVDWRGGNEQTDDVLVIGVRV